MITVTPMTSEQLQAAAAKLRAAEISATPVPPLSDAPGGLTLDDAYTIQLLQVEAWERDGRHVIGHKVGLTSRAMQEQLGVNSPDYGHLYADMVQDETGAFDSATLISPRVEPEIAFVLRTELAGPGVTAEQAAAAIDYAVASLEIVDSRIANWKITLVDTVADNGSSARVVLGSKRATLDELDLEALEVRMSTNGEEPAVGAGAAVLGSPLNAVAWLANTLGERGVVLQAGSLVLPGAMTASAAARPGDTITADFDHLGSVTAAFTKEAR